MAAGVWASPRKVVKRKTLVNNMKDTSLMPNKPTSLKSAGLKEP